MGDGEPATFQPWGKLRVTVFQPCERQGSLSAEALGAVASQLHEDARPAALAADAVALAVEGFEAAAVGALVVNEFNHGILSDSRHFARGFECVHGRFASVKRPMYLAKGPAPQININFWIFMSKRFIG